MYEIYFYMLLLTKFWFLFYYYYIKHYIALIPNHPNILYVLSNAYCRRYGEYKRKDPYQLHTSQRKPFLTCYYIPRIIILDRRYETYGSQYRDGVQRTHTFNNKKAIIMLFKNLQIECQFTYQYNIAQVISKFILVDIIILPDNVCVKAVIRQSTWFMACPFEKAPIASRGIPMNIIDRSLTRRLINNKFHFVFCACNNIVFLVQLYCKLTILIYFYIFIKRKNFINCLNLLYLPYVHI